jgi:two-component system, OmpR family, sensor kinase
MTAAPTPARRRRWLPRSLTARLVLGVVAVVVVVVVVTGTLTAVLLDSFLRDRLDQQLLSTASSDLTSALSGTSAARGVSGPQVVYLAAYERSGTQITIPTSANLAELTLTSEQRAVLESRPERQPTSVTTDSGQRLRVVWVQGTATLTNGVRLPAIVFLGLSEHEVTETMARVLLLEVAIGASAVILAFVITATGMSLSLRPLRRITRTAQEVTAEMTPEGTGLDRRVVTGDSTTEVGELAASFNTMLSVVQTQFTARRESENRMRQFLADASHELRTPLTSIRGYAELARLGGTADTGDAIGRIETEGTRMSRLVDDLLMLARGDDESETPNVGILVDIADVVDEAVEGLRASYPDRPISVDTDADLAVIGDPDQLLRALRNLLINAAVHTRPGGPIRVESHKDGTFVLVKVIDAGPGLPPDEVKHVFERFWRADRARSRARGGSGLGLAIVAQIMRTHGGDVDFESSPDEGSTVTLRLPAAEASGRIEE